MLFVAIVAVVVPLCFVDYRSETSFEAGRAVADLVVVYVSYWVVIDTVVVAAAAVVGPSSSSELARGAWLCLSDWVFYSDYSNFANYQVDDSYHQLYCRWILANSYLEKLYCLDD